MMSESHTGGVFRPVQKPVDPFVSFRRLPKGGRKCEQIPPSAPASRAQIPYELFALLFCDVPVDAGLADRSRPPLFLPR